jgi:hypothetical protein
VFSVDGLGRWVGVWVAWDGLAGKWCMSGLLGGLSGWMKGGWVDECEGGLISMKRIVG